MGKKNNQIKTEELKQQSTISIDPYGLGDIGVEKLSLEFTDDFNDFLSFVEKPSDKAFFSRLTRLKDPYYIFGEKGVTYPLGSGREVTVRYKTKEGKLAFEHKLATKANDGGHKNGGVVMIISSGSALTRIASIRIQTLYNGYLCFIKDHNCSQVLSANHENIDVILVAEDAMVILDEIKDKAQEYDIPIAAFHSINEPVADCYAFDCVQDVIKIKDDREYSRRINNLIEYRRQRRAIDELEHDRESGLLNDATFREDFKSDVFERYSRYSVVVFRILSLHSFNSKNGRIEGAGIIKAASTIIQNSIPTIKLIGRHNEESIAIVTTVAKSNKIKEVVKRINEVVAADGLYALAGIVSNNNKETIDELLEYADYAIKTIKDKKDRYTSTFNETMLAEIKNEQNVLVNFQKGIINKEFQVFYQPKVSVKDAMLAGGEALVRWPAQRILPYKFIPVLEKRGYITTLDKYVLDKVLEDISNWKKSGFKLVPISLNLSRKDFEEDNIAKYLIERVDKYGVEHELIHFEVTESALTEKNDSLRNNVKLLRENGFLVELDDFGSGFSSLNVLAQTPMDVMKIDKVITDGETKEKHSPIISHSIKLAKEFNMKVVVEGVESYWQVNAIKEYGADYIQGWCYSKELSADVFSEKLAANKPFELTEKALED